MSRHRIAALWMIAAAFCASGALAQNAAPADEESARDIVATTVRSQGYACEQPERAARDPAVSLPDQAAWILKCANARYWVRYNDDLAAEIRQLK
jgi:hypothetical protein